MTTVNQYLVGHRCEYHTTKTTLIRAVSHKIIHFGLIFWFVPFCRVSFNSPTSLLPIKHNQLNSPKQNLNFGEKCENIQSKLCVCGTPLSPAVIPFHCHSPIKSIQPVSIERRACVCLSVCRRKRRREKIKKILNSIFHGSLPIEFVIFVW